MIWLLPCTLSHPICCIFSSNCVHVFKSQTAFTSKKDYGREERAAQWAANQRSLHGLQEPTPNNIFSETSTYRELSEIAEQAMKRAEMAR
jgi:H+-transporting ATPase